MSWGFTLYFALTDHENPTWYVLISSVSAVCGVFCVVLCATGKMAQFYWGFANIAAYIFVSWAAKYYGEVMLNALYYLPTQFIGLYVWGKHRDKETNAVGFKKMKVSAAVVSLFVVGLVICGYRMILVLLGGNATWLDSASTALSLVANALMVMRYREQWVLWIVVDVITVTMWILAGDWIQTTMWAVYLLNAFYGLYIWTRLSSGTKA